MAILDHRGRPVNLASLTKEQAHGSIVSVRSPYDDNVAIGLTPARLISLIRAAKDGDHYDYLTLAGEMEERDAHYFSVLQTRKLALVQLGLSVVPVSEDAQDVKEAKAIEDYITKTAAFGESLIHIADGIGKGFSCVEIMWTRKPDIWCPTQYLWRKQKWFQFDRETASEIRIYDGSSDGLPLDPYKFVVHRPHMFSGTSLAGGLARVIAAYHLFKSFAIRDWMAFAEVFGIPIRIGRYDTEATEEDKEALREAVRDIGSDAAAIIPKSVEIEFVRSAQSGFAGSDSFFPSLTGWINKEMSKVVLGQTMTTEDGSSLAQAKVHEGVRTDIRNADARQMENSINRDLVRGFVDLNFGAREEETYYPKIQLDTSESEDLESLAKSLVPFIDRGLQVSTRQILEKFKLSEPDAGETVLGPMAKSDPNDPADPKDSSQDQKDVVSKFQELLAKSTNLRRLKQDFQELIEKRGDE